LGVSKKRKTLKQHKINISCKVLETTQSFLARDFKCAKKLLYLDREQTSVYKMSKTPITCNLASTENAGVSSMGTGQPQNYFIQ